MHKIILGCILLALSMPTMAANIGTVLCDDRDVEVDVTNQTWSNWYNHEAVILIAIATDNTVVSLNQRLSPYTGTYIFRTIKPLRKATIYLTTGGETTVDCS